METERTEDIEDIEVIGEIGEIEDIGERPVINATDVAEECTEWVAEVVAQILLLKESQDIGQLQKICPNVFLDKYKYKHAERQEEAKAPTYLAAVEEIMLYPKNYTRNVLVSVVQVVKETVSLEDLCWVHQMLSNTLLSSAEHAYSDEYDRWLVLLAVKILEMNRADTHLLAYFKAVSSRIEAGAGTFRDRGIVLSEYITEEKITLHTPESAYFQEHIPIEPRVEEECLELEEDSSSEEAITTLAEYMYIVSETSFVSKPDHRKKAAVLSLGRVLARESAATVKRHAQRLVEVLGSFGTEWALQAISEVLLVDTVSLEVLPMVYNRGKYSFYLRHAIVVCLVSIVHRLRADVPEKLLEFFSCPQSVPAEDKKLGIDTLLRRLVCRVQGI